MLLIWDHIHLLNMTVWIFEHFGIQWNLAQMDFKGLCHRNFINHIQNEKCWIIFMSCAKTYSAVSVLRKKYCFFFLIKKWKDLSCKPYFLSFCFLFLVACTRLYNPFSPSVALSLCWWHFAFLAFEGGFGVTAPARLPSWSSSSLPLPTRTRLGQPSIRPCYHNMVPVPPASD